MMLFTTSFVLILLKSDLKLVLFFKISYLTESKQHMMHTYTHIYLHIISLSVARRI